MKEQEQIEKSHMLAREWFSNHIASSMPLPIGTVIDWRRRDTSNYAMRYIITNGYVIVTGDVGDAIYWFGGELTYEKLLSFDWHYFVHKCCASEKGRSYEMKVPGIKYPVPNVRAIGHFIGLQMAIQQLSLKPQATP